MKSVLLLALFASCALAQTYITSVTASTDTSASGSLQRAFAGQPVTFTVTGSNLQAGDQLAWVEATDCKLAAQGNSLTLTTGTTVGTVAFTSGLTAQSAAGAMKLCYRRIMPNGGFYGWQYFGTVFKFSVISVDSWTDGTSTQPATDTTIPLKFYKDTVLPTSALTITGKNFVTGDLVYAVNPSTTGAATTCSGATEGTTTITTTDSIKATFVTSPTWSAAGNAGVKWLCFRSSTQNTPAAANRFDTKLRAAVKTLAATDLYFVFPTYVEADATNTKSFKSGQKFRLAYWGARPGDRVIIIDKAGTKGLTCSAAQTDAGATIKTNYVLAASNFETKAGIQTVVLTAGTNDAFSDAAVLSGTTGAQLYTCIYPVAASGAVSIIETTAVVPKFYAAASGQARALTAPAYAMNIMPNDFSYNVNAIIARGIVNTVFVSGFLKEDNTDLFTIVATASCTGTVTGGTAIADYTWPILDLTIAASATGTAHSVCHKTSAGVTILAVAVDSYGSASATAAITKDTTTTAFSLPTTFNVLGSQKWFMASWVPVSGGLDFWNDATTKWNNGVQDTAAAKIEFILARSATADIDCAINSVVGVSNARGATRWDRDTAGTTNSAFRLAGNGGSVTSNIMGAAALDVAAKTDHILCIRLTDTGKASNWFKTAIKVSQYPNLVIQTQQVNVIASGASTPKIFMNGLVTGDKLSFTKTTGVTFTNNHCDAALVMQTPVQDATTGGWSVTIPFLAGTFDAVSQNHAACILRAPETVAIPMYLAAGAGAWATSGVPSTPAAASTITATIENDFYQGVGSAISGLSWASPFDATKTIDLMKTTTTCTGTADATVTLTVSNAYVWADDLVAARTNTITASGKIGAALVDLPNGVSGNSAWCHNGVRIGSGVPRLVAIPGACAVTAVGTGCADPALKPAVPTSAKFHVLNAGTYYPLGMIKTDPSATTGTKVDGVATGFEIWFDATNAISTDSVTFVISTSTTAPTKTTTLASTTTLSGTTKVSGSAKLAASQYGNFDAWSSAGTQVGGQYNLWIKPNAGAWTNTGHALTVVQYKARYPSSLVQVQDTGIVYFDELGFAAGDAYLTTDADCASTVFDATVLTKFSGAKATVVPATTTTPTSITFPFPAQTTPANVAFTTLCYRAPGQTTASSTAADNAGYASFALTFTSIANPTAGPALADIKVPVLKAGASAASNVVYLLDNGAATTVTLTLNGGVGTVSGYTPQIYPNGVACTVSPVPATKPGTATAITKIATSYTDSTTTFTAKLTSQTVEATNVYPICYTGRSAPTAADFAAMAETIQVRPVPASVGKNIPYILTNARSGTTQNIDIAYATGTTVTLKATDNVCFVEKGGSLLNGRTDGGAIKTPATATTAAVYFFSKCAAVDAAGLVVDVKNIAGSFTPGSEYEVWVSAGAAVCDGSTPVKIANALITAVSAEVRPWTVLQTAGSDKRTVYAKLTPTSTTDQFHFVATAGAACTGITTANGGAPTGATSKVAAAFTTADTYTICFLSGRETTATKANWLPLSGTVISVATAGTDSSANGNLMIPGAAVISAKQYYRIQAAHPTAVNFDYRKSAAQETDVIRVLTYASNHAIVAPAVAKTCATSAAGDATDSAANAGAFDLVKDSSSVTSSLTIPKLPATVGNSELTGCYKQGFVSAPTNANGFADLPVPLFIRPVDVMTFAISTTAVSATVNPLIGAAGNIRTMNMYYQSQIWLTGHWLDNNDFVSFVPKADKDCANAWWFENAVVGTDAAFSETVSSSGYSVTFESGLPQGAYQLCYLVRGATYRLYTDISQTLRVVDATVSPAFATPGVATTYTLTLTTAPGDVVFTSLDRATLTAAGKADCATTLFTQTNLTATNSFTGTIPFGGAATYEVCMDLSGADGYSTWTGTNPTQTYIAPSGNLACYAGQAMTGSTTGARTCYGEAVTSPYHIKVSQTPKIFAVRPSTVVRNMPTDLVFGGSYLDGADGVSFNISTNGNECATPDFSVPLAPNPSPNFASTSVAPKKSFANIGTYNVCYKYANATTPTQGTAAHGVKVTVAGVTSITPTSTPAAAFVAGTSDLKVTVTGFFNLDASDTTKNGDADFNYAGLIPRDFTVTDCGGLDVNLATGELNKIKTTSATSGTITFDKADAPKAGEYMMCVHFAGMRWSNPINPKTDFVLIDHNAVNINIRQIDDFFPKTVVNGTIAVVPAQTIFLAGPGLRDNDTVTTVPSTSAAATDCSGATAVPATPVAVTNGAASFNLPVSGTFKVCYKSSATNAAWEFAANGAVLTARSPVISTLSTGLTGNPDVAVGFRVSLTGTGLSQLDSARLVNSSTIATSCEGAGSPWTKVTSQDPRKNEVFWWDIVSGDLPVGSYGLCYKWAGATAGTAYPALTVTTVSGPRALAAAPRFIAKPAATNFFIVGQNLDKTDTYSLQVGACTTGTGVVGNLISAGSATTKASANVTLTATAAGTFNLCYYPKGTVANGQTAAVVTVGADAPAACVFPKKFFCNGVCVAAAAGSTASPCAPAVGSCPANPSFVFCPLTGFCARTADDCSSILATLNQAQPCLASEARCFDGSCAPNALACPPLAAPPAGYARCIDGSLSANGACTTSTGSPITKTCQGVTAAKPYCPAGGCPLSGTTLDACPPYDGCPAGSIRCSDCVCRPGPTFCAAQSNPFICSNGLVTPKASDCKCHRFTKIAHQQIVLGTAGRRRFVVKASAAVTALDIMGLLNSNDPLSTQKAATLAFDANVAVDNNCLVNLMSLPESPIDAAIQLSPPFVIAAPTIVISINNATAAGAAPVACKLNPALGITVTFPNVEMSSGLTCSSPLAGVSVNITAGPTPNSCRISGAAIQAVAVTLSTGKINPVVPPTVAPPNPTGAATGAAATGAAPTGAAATGGAATGAPTGGATTPTVSAAPVQTLSAALMAFALVLVAMLV